MWPFHQGNHTHGNRPGCISSQNTAPTTIIYFSVYDVLIATNKVIGKKLHELLSLEISRVYLKTRESKEYNQPSTMLIR